jgi:hypothetical protein
MAALINEGGQWNVEKTALANLECTNVSGCERGDTERGSIRIERILLSSVAVIIDKSGRDELLTQYFLIDRVVWEIASTLSVGGPYSENGAMHSLKQNRRTVLDLNCDKSRFEATRFVADKSRLFWLLSANKTDRKV